MNVDPFLIQLSIHLCTILYDFYHLNLCTSFVKLIKYSVIHLYKEITRSIHLKKNILIIGLLWVFKVTFKNISAISWQRGLFHLWRKPEYTDIKST